MKTDLYTKVLLTLITIFLGVLAADRIYETAIPKAEAENNTPMQEWKKWECFSWEGGKKKDKYGLPSAPTPLEQILNSKKYNWSFMTMTQYTNTALKVCGRK